MKKQYQIPTLTAVFTAQSLLQSASQQKPSVSVDATKSISAESVESKGRDDSFDVWDDDWNK